MKIPKFELLLIFLIIFFLANGVDMAQEAFSDGTLTEKELKSKLTPLQYKVTMEDGTEPPFQNKYWNNKQPGIYVDVISGEPLFCSLDKYESGTGWPSFTKPLEPDNLILREDRNLSAVRTEVRSSRSDAHLGHVFDDGPAPTGQRYCVNSAALIFIPVEELAQRGYGEYLVLFGESTGEDNPGHEANPSSASTDESSSSEVAVFGAGCFWGVEEILRKIPGVNRITVGYSGGVTTNPTYEQVSSKTSGHAEVVQIEFDSAKVTYEELLDYFFRLHDPTTMNRQGNDVGTQYRSVIFYQNEEQKKLAEKKKAEVDRSGKWTDPVVTEIVAAKPFYSAEEYHQDYLQKNPGGYSCHYLRD
jgi:peptide methionine sulfoxide reductase msrA/msrB